MVLSEITKRLPVVSKYHSLSHFRKSFGKIPKNIASTPERLNETANRFDDPQSEGLPGDGMNNQKCRLPYLAEQSVIFETTKVIKKTEDTMDEVVFNSEIDDTQYYLTRRRPKGSNLISLSPRERAIAQLVAQGFDNKSIGKNLNISHWTVATYLRRVFSKLGVNSRSAMIARIFEENLLDD